MEIFGFLIRFIGKFLFKECVCVFLNPSRKIRISDGHLDGTTFWNLCLIPTFSGLGKSIELIFMLCPYFILSPFEHPIHSDSPVIQKAGLLN